MLALDAGADDERCDVIAIGTERQRLVSPGEVEVGLRSPDHFDRRRSPPHRRHHVPAHETVVSQHDDAADVQRVHARNAAK